MRCLRELQFLNHRRLPLIFSAVPLVFFHTEVVHNGSDMQYPKGNSSVFVLQSENRVIVQEGWESRPGLTALETLTRQVSLRA